MDRYCKKCNIKYLNTEYSFCGQCGSRLESMSVPTMKPPYYGAVTLVFPDEEKPKDPFWLGRAAYRAGKPRISPYQSNTPEDNRREAEWDRGYDTERDLYGDNEYDEE